MQYVILAVLLGLLPAYIASKKGRSFLGWWFFGAALFIVALPAAMLIKEDTEALERQKLEMGYRKCPFCAELIEAEATVCKHCGRDPSNDWPAGGGVVGRLNSPSKHLAYSAIIYRIP